jgi:preprotein translocase subunit SecG
MLTFFTVLLVLVALLLICVILIQEPKSTGGGLFSGTGQSLLGTSGKTFWTKFTTVLAFVFFILCLGLAALPGRRSGSSLADDIQKDQQRAAEAAAAAVTQADPKTDVGAQKAPAAEAPASATDKKPAK